MFLTRKTLGRPLQDDSLLPGQVFQKMEGILSLFVSFPHAFSHKSI